MLPVLIALLLMAWIIFIAVLITADPGRRVDRARQGDNKRGNRRSVILSLRDIATSCHTCTIHIWAES